jgi:hypothetical protein
MMRDFQQASIRDSFHLQHVTPLKGGVVMKERMHPQDDNEMNPRAVYDETTSCHDEMKTSYCGEMTTSSCHDETTSSCHDVHRTGHSFLE